MANGALEVFQAFVDKIGEKGINVVTELDKDHSYGKEACEKTLVSASGCQGFCQMGPLVRIFPDGILYVKVRAEDVAEIVEKTIMDSQCVERLLYHDERTGEICRGVDEIAFYKRQNRTVLASCGLIDPEDINEYIHNGGYRAARKVYLEMKPEDVCEEVSISGLRGRAVAVFRPGKNGN